jgi:UDP-N-acetylglucosamine 2-epimerase (non-hydrolysing)
MLIHLVCGARPNFMKVAPLYHALKKTSWATPIIVHTGQHYDVNMSEAFFTDLGLPQPDMFLQVGSGSHAEQTAKVMVAYERILLQTPPDVVVVVGDVNSTMAATLAATKLGIKVAHLEAGLRSFDRRMPEEINRLVTDVLADELWVPSRDGVDNLIREGVAPEKIKLVGNIMIDSLEMLRDRIEKENTPQALNLAPRSYGIVTLHRPSNVDDPAALARVCGILTDVPGSSAHPEEHGRGGPPRQLGAFAPDTAAGADELHPIHESRDELRDRDHRLGWNTGRDDASRDPVPHGQGEHRETDHRDSWHESAVSPR